MKNMLLNESEFFYHRCYYFKEGTCTNNERIPKESLSVVLAI